MKGKGMNQLEKAVFQFYSPSGEIETDIEVYRDNPEFYAELLQKRAVFYGKQVSTYEEMWVKQELARTDYMTLPDATYKGERLAYDGSKVKDLMNYRDQLRKYQWRTHEPRPVKPEWLQDD